MVVGYFTLLWLPSAHFAGVKFNPIKNEVVGYTLKTNSFNPGYTVTAKQKTVFKNKLNQKQCIDELTTAAQGRSDLTNVDTFLALRNAIFYNNGRNEGPTTFGDITITINPFYETTSTPIEKKRLSFKDWIDWDPNGKRSVWDPETSSSKIQVGTAIVSWHFVTLAIYLALWGLFELFRLWLRFNYKELTRRK